MGGSGIYAANDPNLKSLSDEERERLLAVERIVYFYLPRICNHCANPSCVAACPAGAIYKRGEDGIVLVSQEKCMGWRMCISGCPPERLLALPDRVQGRHGRGQRGVQVRRRQPATGV